MNALQRPADRRRRNAFRSRRWEVVRERELEALAVEMYARGFSARDIEALMADQSGKPL